jgi:hypothetical protein
LHEIKHLQPKIALERTLQFVMLIVQNVQNKVI